MQSADQRGAASASTTRKRSDYGQTEEPMAIGEIKPAPSESSTGCEPPSPGAKRKMEDGDDVELESEAEVEAVTEGVAEELLSELENLAAQAAAAAPSPELRALHARIRNFAKREEVDGESSVILPLGNNGLGKSFLISCLSEMTCVDGARYKRSSQMYMLENPVDSGMPKGSVNIDALECLRDIPIKSLVKWDELEQPNLEEDRARQEAVKRYCSGDQYGDNAPYLYPSANGMESTTSYNTESIYSGIFHCAVTYYSIEEMREFVNLYRTYENAPAFSGLGDAPELLSARLQEIFGEVIPSDADQVTEASFPEAMRPWLGKTRWFCGSGESLELDRIKCRDIQRVLLSQYDEPNNFAICRPLIKVNRIGQPAEFLQGGVKYLDVPGLNDDDPIKTHHVNEAVQQTDVLMIIHERTLQQAKNIRDSLKDPTFGKEFFNDFRAGQRAIIFLMMQEKGAQKSLRSFLEHDVFEKKKREFHVATAKVRKQFKDAFKERWQDAEQDELDALAGRVVIEHCYPLLHLSTLLNAEAVAEAKSTHGVERVKELLDFISVHGLFAMPEHLKFQQLHKRLREGLSQAITAEIDRMKTWRVGPQPSIGLKAEDGAAVLSQCQILERSNRRINIAARREFQARLSEIPNLKGQMYEWAEELVQCALSEHNRAGDEANIEAGLVEAKRGEEKASSVLVKLRDMKHDMTAWFMQVAVSLDDTPLRAALSPAFKRDHKSLPLVSEATDRIYSILFSAESPLALASFPQRFIDAHVEDGSSAVVDGVASKLSAFGHFKKVVLDAVTPPDAARATRSASIALRPLDVWLRAMLDRFMDSTARSCVHDAVTLCVTQTLHARKFKEEIKRKLRQHLTVICERQLNATVARESTSRASLMLVTRHVVEEWLDEHALCNVLTELVLERLNAFVLRSYTDIVSGVMYNAWTALQHFKADANNKSRVRRQLNRGTVAKAAMQTELTKLWQAATLEERLPYNLKAERGRKRARKKQSILAKLGLLFVEELLAECKAGYSTIDTTDTTQLALDSLEQLRHQLEILQWDSKANEARIQNMARAMCNRIVAAKTYSELLERNIQLDFSMTYKTSAFRVVIDRVIDHQEWIPMKEISRTSNWCPYPTANTAFRVLQTNKFTCKPTNGPVDSLLANALHQLKGCYRPEDVAALRNYICRWMINTDVYDAHFRNEAESLIPERETFEQFVHRMSEGGTHPFLLECLCRAINVGFLVWSTHLKPVLFGTLRKRTKIFNLLCVGAPESPEFQSLVVRRYKDDFRLDGNPSPRPPRSRSN